MIVPQPPLREDLNKAGVATLPWTAFFSGIVRYIKDLPPSNAILTEAANDAAAAAAGVKLYGYYKTGSIVKQRIV